MLCSCACLPGVSGECVPRSGINCWVAGHKCSALGGAARVFQAGCTHLPTGGSSKVSGFGVPWWLSGLRIQYCHCCGLGCLCVEASSPKNSHLPSSVAKKKKSLWISWYLCPIHTESGESASQRVGAC